MYRGTIQVEGVAPAGGGQALAFTKATVPASRAFYVYGLRVATQVDAPGRITARAVLVQSEELLPDDGANWPLARATRAAADYFYNPAGPSDPFRAIPALTSQARWQALGTETIGLWVSVAGANLVDIPFAASIEYVDAPFPAGQTLGGWL